MFPRSTVDAAIKRAIQQGNIAELQSLAEVAGTQAQQQIIRDAVKRLSTKAGDFVSKFCKSKVNREFPGQFRNKTVAEVIQAARQNVPGAARAKKLITELRFRK